MALRLQGVSVLRSAGVNIRSSVADGSRSSLAARVQEKTIAERILCGRAIVVVQHTAQSLPPLYRTRASHMTGLGKNDSIGQPLVVSLAMIMRHEISNGRLERRPSKQNHPLETGFL